MLLICLIYLASTIFLGYSITISFLKKTFSGTIQLSISWLIGSSMTSLLIYLISFVMNITIIHLFFIIFIQISFAYFLYRRIFNYYFGENRKILYLTFERFPLLFALILISTFFTILFSMNKHYNDPDFILSFKNPRDYPFYIKIVLSDYNIISQLIDVNASNTSFFTRFICTNEIFINSKSLSILPHLFTSSFILCGLTYEESSLIIAFLNTFSTAVSLFITFSTLRYSFFTSLFLIFYSSFYFTDFPPLLQLLIISKEASFSIPMMLFSISMNYINNTNLFNNLYRFIPFLSFCIPTAYLNIILFISFLAFSPFRRKYFHYIFLLIPKLFLALFDFSFNLFYVDISRKFKTVQQFLSTIIFSFITYFSPFFIVYVFLMIKFSTKATRTKVFQQIIYFIPILFFTQKNKFSTPALSHDIVKVMLIYSFVLPGVMIGILESFQLIRNSLDSQTIRLLFDFVIYSTLFCFIFIGIFRV